MNGEVFHDYLSQGISLMTEENYAAAKEMFLNALKLNPRSEEAYYHLGNANANLGEFEEALTAFKKALTIKPDSADLLFSVASAYLMKNDKLHAVEYYNKAEAAGFQRVELYQILATIFYEANDTKQALRNITKAIAAEPFSGEARLLKARIYLADNRFEEALETLSDMQKILPDAYEVYDLQAQIYTGLGKLEEALRVAEAGNARFPEDPVIALTKLKVLISMKKDQEAEQLLNQMKNMPRYDVIMKEAVLQESIIYLRKEDVNSALKILVAANDALGQDDDLLYVLLDLYAKLDMHDKTKEIANALIACNPNPYYLFTAKFFLAHSAEQEGNVEFAKAQYKKLTSELRKYTIQNPAFYEGYIFRLLSHARIGEFKQALELADYIENLHPDRTDAYAFRYNVYMLMGEKEKAEKEKQKVLEINPEMKL